MTSKYTVHECVVREASNFLSTISTVIHSASTVISHIDVLIVLNRLPQRRLIDSYADCSNKIVETLQQ